MNDVYQRTWGEWFGRRELFRGLLHTFPAVGIIFFLQIVQVDLTTGIALCSIGWLIIALDLMRAYWIEPLIKDGEETEKFLKWRKKYKLLGWLWSTFYPHLKKYVYREKENGRISSGIWAVLGFSFAYIAFPNPITLLAVAFLVADPIARVIGVRSPKSRKFKRGRAKGKSIDGLLAGIFSCLLIAVVVLLIDGVFNTPIYNHLPIWQYALIVTIGALTTGIVELFSGKLDNVTIPACSATAMWLITFLIPSL